EAIREQISEYNEQIMQLNQQVEQLEEQLEQMGAFSANRRREPVTLIELEEQSFANYVNINASVEAVKEAQISPEINGQIQQIRVTKGQRVQPGQVVARLNTSVIENNIREVETSLQLARTRFERQQALWDQQIGSEIQYLEAKSNLESLESRLQTLESQLAMATLRSPIQGIVDDIFLKEGELAMPGVPVAHVIALDPLNINADVSESFLPVMDEDDQVILRFPSFPDYEQQVDIHRLGNVINPENRTFRLQLRIRNPQERFKPNMVATIAIRSFYTDSAIVVPSILVKQDAQGFFVYTAVTSESNELMAEKIYVERTMSSEGNTMISDGLQQGDLVINRGHNQVNDGDMLEISGR
ncbi:MAG: efflux RND transporter periplasmic adaptor subunit, partial [Bacteroidales bacterium]